MAYIVAVGGIQHDNRIAAFFDDHAPELFDRVWEWQLRQHVRQR